MKTKLERIQMGRAIAEKLGEPLCTIQEAANKMGISRPAASKLEAIALYKVATKLRELAAKENLHLPISCARL